MNRGEGRRVADIACLACGEETELRVTKKGRLYVTCFNLDCGCQVFSRSRACDRRLAARASGWATAEDAAAFGAVPPRAAPAPMPARRGWLDRPLFGDDE
jgi:hypothetical protein